jgi:hypothetical protein
MPRALLNYAADSANPCVSYPTHGICGAAPFGAGGVRILQPCLLPFFPLPIMLRALLLGSAAP